MRQHKTKYTVKHLSGRSKGKKTYVETLEEARIEAFYLSDCCNICSVIIPPLFEKEF